MPSNADDVILTFPPRPISDWERALVAEWFAATRHDDLGITRAYVSERRGGDPVLAGRTMVVELPNKLPSHVIYSPAGSIIWVTSSAPLWRDLRRFGTLRAALDAIRPVFDEPDETPDRELASSIVW
jgi:hypothetical protein